MNNKFLTTALFIGIFSAANAEIPEYFKTEVRHVCKHAHSYTAENSNIYLVKDRQGKVLGKVYTDRFDDAQRKFGYAGTIEVAVLTDTEDKVTGVLIGKNQETPRFLDRIRQAKFLEQWNKLHLKDVSGKKVDAVTRATLSNTACAKSPPIRSNSRSPATAMISSNPKSPACKKCSCSCRKCSTV